MKEISSAFPLSESAGKGLIACITFTVSVCSFTTTGGSGHIILQAFVKTSPIIAPTSQLKAFPLFFLTEVITFFVLDFFFTKTFFVITLLLTSTLYLP